MAATSMHPNPYLLDLENRQKRRHRLAHEANAGARCNKCGDKCPGFELHFWRKICLKCRCAKDDHEIYEDDVDIGQIFIGKILDLTPRTQHEESQYIHENKLDMLNKVTEKTEAVQFDWIPPGITSTLAARYMELLPVDKRPVTGSQAAKDRRRQLGHQLPLHDLDEEHRCESLPPEEIEKFHEFVERVKTNVAGQGVVTEIGSITPQSYDVLFSHVVRNGEKQLDDEDRGASMYENSDLEDDHDKPDHEVRHNQLQFPNINVTGNENSGRVAKREDDGIKNLKLSDEVGNTQQGQASTGRIGGPLPSLRARDGTVQSVGAVQAPYGVQKEITGGPYAMAAPISEVLIILPHESQVLVRRPVSFATSQRSKYVCQRCHLYLNVHDVAIFCDHAGKNACWHPSCFVCNTCQELLVDLIYFYIDGQIYCGRHFAEAADVPRCKACDELIFSEEWTRADGSDWHLHHFCCHVCDKKMAGSQYITDANGHPYCMPCYMAYLAKFCESCEQKIYPDAPRCGYNGYFYHASTGCFQCHSCRQVLLQHKFKMAKNWLYCDRYCIENDEASLMRNPHGKKKE